MVTDGMKDPQTVHLNIRVTLDNRADSSEIT